MNVGDWSFLEQITELLAQLIVFLFQLGAEGFNFLKGLRIRDAHGGMIGEDPQPLKILITEHAGVEDGQHAQHFAAKDQRLRGECLVLTRIDGHLGGGARN